jgi:uncharacterized membrane protein YphA (DoxX/SURF4 family)
MIADLARRWSARIDATIDVGHLAWMRMALGPIALLHLAPFLRDSLDGTTYLDSFHLPYVSWYPPLPGPLYVALLWLAAAAAVLLTVGLLSRPAAAVTAGVVAYNLFVSQAHYSNNRAFLLILLLGAAALPVGGAPSVDAWLARRRDRTPGPGTTTRAWVVDLLRFEVAAVYLASGFSKLIDPDWWGGTVLALRVERGVEEAAAAGVPRSVVELLADPTMMWWGAKLVVLTELFIGLGLWFPRTRRAAVLVTVVFHVSIQVTADVEVFTWAALAALALWAPTPAIDAPGPPAPRRPARSRPRPAPA